MSKKKLIWKIPLTLVGILLGLVMFLLIAVTCIFYIPSLRNAVIGKGISIACEKTGYDIDLGGLDISPFHQSPLTYYRAWRGKTDLPIEVKIDSLFVGHRGQDTLIYVHALRLHATVVTSYQHSKINFQHFTDIPIIVDELLLDGATFHSDSMIPAVGIDAIVGHLAATCPELNIGEGRFPLQGLCLADTYVSIDLRETPPTPTDTTVQDTTPMRMCYEIPDGELRNIHFRLTPLGLDVSTRSIRTNALVDVGGNSYCARRIDIGATNIGINDFQLPIDTFYGDAKVELERNLITSQGLYVRSDGMGAKAHLRSSEMDLETMRAATTGEAEYQGSQVQLRASYDIDDEAYDAHVDIQKVDLAALLQDSTRIVIAGQIDAKGKGIDPSSPAMRSNVKLHLDDAIYDQFDVSGTDLQFTTDKATSLSLATEGLDVHIASPMPAMRLVDQIIASSSQFSGLTTLDSLHSLIPEMQADIALQQGSPAQQIIEDIGVDIQEVGVSLRSDTALTSLDVQARTGEGLPTGLRLPAAQAAIHIALQQDSALATLRAGTRLTDGVMTLHGLKTHADLRFDVTQHGEDLQGTGYLKLDELALGDMDFGSRRVDLSLANSEAHENALKAGVQLDDIPLAIVDSLLHLGDIQLDGAIRAQATADGLPAQLDLSAEVRPVQVAATYKPYDIQIGLGEIPIVMKHNQVDLNGLPVYGADSTYLALYGGLDIDRMRLDVTLAADSFAPVKLPKDGPFPVYGELATDIHGNVSGALDSIVADVAVTLLPTTDITYPIDKKNLAQVKPHGTTEIRYDVAESQLQLGGQVNVDDGFVRYSPKMYPIMPFHVDSGSHIAFNGPIGQTMLDVSASQKVKADVESEDEETRRVDFRTGVRMHGIVDSIGLNTISFFLEAPEDEAVTQELASLDEETREGLAATLLATGMYVGESNVAAQRSGYAFSSIVNSRINAAMANSKMGKVVDIDLSSAQTEHAGGKTNDLNVTISKSFLKDRLRITVGSTFTDDPEINQASGLLNNLSAEYKLTKEGNVLLRAFAQRDYNNILEGDLYKSGLGVRATKDWKKPAVLRRSSSDSLSHDTIIRVYGLTADAGVAYRSNNSIGPDLTLKTTLKNLLGNGETFTIKANGAYYWALRNRHPGDPKKTDTYKIGVNTSLVYPYLHWAGKNNPAGDTRYMFGYQYENIAGGYGVHKLTGSFSYFIRTSRYITHAFTPFSLSVVLMKAESDSLLNKAAEYPQLIKVIAGNEFVPSIGYNFIYNDYRSKRAVNTMLDLGVKESGNLINALYCAFGHSWNEKNKKLGGINFNQFVKLTAELRNKFNFTDQVCIATRLFAGANIPLGNSNETPLSEAFYAGGPNNMRACSPYAYGPGNFYSEKYNQNFFHAGDVKLEANFELRFPIVWKLYGATFLDAGNVWHWQSAANLFKEAGITDYVTQLQLREELYDGLIDNPDLLRQIALGTGAGLRLDLDGLVIRLDIGVAIHAPFQTYKYNKKTWQPDKTQPINTYFNIPSALDAIRINFGIGYPF